MKKFMPVILLLVLFAVTAEARVRWGGRVGIVDGEPMIGGEMVMPIGGGFWFNPNIEVSSEVISTNADAHYDIELTRQAVLWFGAGIALINPDGQDLDVGVNVLAGIGTNRGGRIFYAQAKVVAPSDYDGYNSIAVGIRF